MKTTVRRFQKERCLIFHRARVCRGVGELTNERSGVLIEQFNYTMYKRHVTDETDLEFLFVCI